jgi:hypothetical protein
MSTYGAQCNGHVERFRRTVHTGLSFHLKVGTFNRDDNVDYMLWAYRCQPELITRFFSYYAWAGDSRPTPC